MTGVVRSQRTAGRLAGLTSVDLVWRVPDVTPGEGAGVDIAVAVLSLAIDAGDVAVLEEATTWLLLGYVAATLAPRAYPGKLGVPADESGYRVLFGLATVGFALTIRRGTDSATAAAMLAILSLTVVCGVALLAYLRWGCKWTLAPADERFLTLIDAFFPTSSVEDELRRDFARSGVLGLVGRTVARGAAGGILVFPAFLSGIVVVVLVLLYPLPDLLILGWSGLLTVEHVTGREVAPDPGRLDVEERLYDIVEEATKSIKGMTLGIYLVALTFGFGLLFAVTVGLVTTAATDGVPVGTRSGWNVFGLVVVVAASSCYGLWCCFRLARRLPAFLRQHVEDSDRTREASRASEWETQIPAPRDVGAGFRWWQADQFEHVGSTHPRNRSIGVHLPRRPVGTVVPPIAVVMLAGVVAAGYGLDSWALAVAWPLLLLGLAICLVLTRYVGRRAIRHDDHAIIIGMAVFVCTSEVIGNLETIVDALQAGVVVPGTLPTSVYVAGIVVWLGYLDEAFRYGDRHNDVRRLAKSAYFLALAAVFGGLLSFTGGPYHELLVMVVVASGLGGCALFLTGWFRL